MGGCGIVIRMGIERLATATAPVLGLLKLSDTLPEIPFFPVEFAVWLLSAYLKGSESETTAIMS
jgi:hypothetical protein